MREVPAIDRPCGDRDLFPRYAAARVLFIFGENPRRVIPGGYPAAMAGGAPTSLALLGESVTGPVEVCPHPLAAKRRWVNDTTGEVRPYRCGGNGCPFCGPRKAHGISLAVADAKPERWIRYSLVGDNWAQVRARIKAVTYWTRQAGYAFELAYYVHENPEGTGLHAHAHQHGSFVPQGFLQATTARAGMGYPDIRRWEERSVMGTAYGMRELLGTAYATREVQGDGLYRYLARNGGRMVHTSRGFWRRQDGRPVSGVKSAIHAAYEARYGEESGVGRWLLVSV